MKERYKPCSCDLSDTKCLNCAVDFVIITLGWNMDCECIRFNLAKTCRKCKLHEQFRIAFSTAKPPYEELARQRLQSTAVSPVRISEGYHAPLQDDEEASKILTLEAEPDPISYQAALLLFREIVLNDDIVPKRLKLFVSEVACNLRIPPRLQGKYKDAVIPRDREIAHLILDLVNSTGLKATSNDASDEKSACHAVATAFAVLGLQPKSYESLRQIWRKRQVLLEIDARRRV